MEQITVTLVILAATWGGMFNVMKIVEMKNGIRNLCLDIHKDPPLSRDKKELLISHDYIPLSAGIFLFLLLFAGAFISIPFTFWAKAPEKLGVAEAATCFGAAAFCIFALFVDLVASISEVKKMNKHIAALPTTEDKASDSLGDQGHD